MSPEEREQLILSCADDVLKYARILSRGIPDHVHFDDLLSCAWVGAINAVDRYNPAHNAQLSTFIAHKVKGAILDFSRREDPLTRMQRKRAKAAGLTGYRYEELDQGMRDPRQDFAEAVIERVTFHKLLHTTLITRQERRIIKHLLKGKDIKVVAKRVGITKAAVSQAKLRVVCKMRAAIHQ